MPISFNEIPPDFRVPLTWIEVGASRPTTSSGKRRLRILIVAQKLAAGTFTALVPTRLASLQQAIAGGGAGSMLHAMAEALLRNNKTTETWVVALADAAGSTKWTRPITFGGAPTLAGTIYVYITGRRIAVPVLTTSTPTSLADHLVASVTAMTALLPVTAANVAGVVTLTAKHGGTVANDFDVRHSYNVGEAVPAGVTVVIGAAVAGATDPDVGTVWPVLGDEPYDVIVSPYADTASLASVEQECDRRWNALVRANSYAFVASAKDLSGLLTLGAARNNLHVSIVETFGSPHPTYEHAAATAAQVTPSAANDPMLPFRGKPLLGLLPPAPQDRFTVAERDQLLHTGITTTFVNDNGNVLLERVITTYKRTSLNVDDNTFLDANMHFGLSFIRWDSDRYFSGKYGNAKVADNASKLGAGQVVLTENVARAEFISLARDWEAAGIVEKVDEEFIPNLVVERDANDPTRMNAQITPNMVNPLNLIGIQVQPIA